MPRMHPLLTQALDEAAPLIAERHWIAPSDAALADAERLLALVAHWRAPGVEFDPDGTVALTWEAADRGWVSLAVRGDASVTHAAVIGEDEFGQVEPFASELPPWAAHVLERLLADEH